MPAYQIHRLKEAQRAQFRWAPHMSGVAIAKPKDYEPGAVLEAAGPYALWLALKETAQALAVGDIVQLESGELRILKYIGFDEAKWYVPEPAPASTGAPLEVT